MLALPVYGPVSTRRSRYVLKFPGRKRTQQCLVVVAQSPRLNLTLGSDVLFVPTMLDFNLASTVPSLAEVSL